MKVGRNFGCDLGSRTKRSDGAPVARQSAGHAVRKCENASHAVGDMSMFHQYQLIFG
jgi:hypothetical protein